MSLVLRQGKADDQIDQIADLIWSTDVELMEFTFPSYEIWTKVARTEWRQPKGLISHLQATIALSDGEVAGITVGHTSAEYPENFDYTVNLQREIFSADELAHHQDALIWMDRLFPPAREDAFYVQELAVAPRFRGQGLGKRLLAAALERAKAAGAQRISLDVAEANPSVAVYNSLGFETEIETRVPYLEERGIGRHLHMSLPVADAGALS
ncbi:MAG: GNAT family N-acetyltransferase [Pseudomonadota bacterium]